MEIVVDADQNSPRLSRSRSKLSNRYRSLPGFDGRSTEARRYKDLVDGYTQALGGKLTEAQITAARRCAELTVLAEQTRARALRGEAVDQLALVRLEGSLNRAIRALGIEPPRPSRRRRGSLFNRERGA
jgi:hypothetical protein